MRASLVNPLSHSDPVMSVLMVEVALKPFQWRAERSGFARRCRSSPLSSWLDNCTGEEDSRIHLRAYVLFFHNLERERERHQKLCLLPAPCTLALAGLGLFELQRDRSLPLPHRHSVWIVISYRPLFSLPAFSSPSSHLTQLLSQGKQLRTRVNTCSTE